MEAWFGHFDPFHPTSLIFKRNGDRLQLVGVMYTASNSVDRDDLDARVPLSYGTWHRHIDFCRAPAGTPRSEYFGRTRVSVLAGYRSIRPEACTAAGWQVRSARLRLDGARLAERNGARKIWAVDIQATA